MLIKFYLFYKLYHLFAAIPNPTKDIVMIYRQTFGKDAHQNIIRQNIKLIEYQWIRELKIRGIIDEKCANDISSELDDKEKGIIVVKHLIKMNDIKKYDDFLTLWQEIDPAYATKFKNYIQKQVENCTTGNEYCNDILA